MQVIEHPRGKPRPRFRRGLALLLVALAALICAGAYLVHAARRASRSRARSPPVPVTVIAAASRNVPIYLDALGTVSASNTVAIRSQITGTLQTVNFTEGQEVHQGDTLAVIDPRPLQAALDAGASPRRRRTRRSSSRRRKTSRASPTWPSTTSPPSRASTSSRPRSTSSRR